jgi:hypothetical protein
MTAQDVTMVRGETCLMPKIHVILQRLWACQRELHHHRLIRDSANGWPKRDDARAIAKYRADGISLMMFDRMGRALILRRHQLDLVARCHGRVKHDKSVGVARRPDLTHDV